MHIMNKLEMVVLTLAFLSSIAEAQGQNVFPQTGNVGIGTTAPVTQLHVNGNQLRLSTPGNPSRLVELRTDGAAIDINGNGADLYLHSNTGNTILQAFRGQIGIGTTSPGAKLDVNGTTRTTVLQITGGADLAEPFEVVAAKAIKPGMLMSIDPTQPGQLRISSEAYDRTVAGIISGANGLSAGLMMGQNGSAADGSHPLALTGRVYTLADADASGPIAPGDLLTTSNTLGHAMKVADYPKAQGAIIGKAMSSLERGQGFVLTLVSLQ
jgi:hypothetical protein